MVSQGGSWESRKREQWGAEKDQGLCSDPSVMAFTEQAAAYPAGG